MRYRRNMQEKEAALGIFVLIIALGAFLYFKYPEIVKRWLYGPSLPEIETSIKTEAEAFKAETDYLMYELTRSVGITPYLNLNRRLALEDYEGRIRAYKETRDNFISQALRRAGKKLAYARSLEERIDADQSLLDALKRANAPTQAAQNEISYLDTLLSAKRQKLDELKTAISKGRAQLNQRAFFIWFARSLAVAIPASLLLVLLGLFAVPQSKKISASASSAETSITEPSISAPSSEKPRIADSAVFKESDFRSNLSFPERLVSSEIAPVLKTLPGSKTAHRLARILSAYPDAAASASHHSSGPGGLIRHTAKTLELSREAISRLPDPKAGAVAVLAHDLGKAIVKEGSPHDIASADILTTLPELKEEFDRMTAAAIVLAVRHQHSPLEMPLNAPPLATRLLEAVKEADSAAAAEETKQAAAKIREMESEILRAFQATLREINVNRWQGGWPEGFTSDGYLFLFKEPLKEKLLKAAGSLEAPVFKGVDPVWNEVATLLESRGFLTGKIGEKKAREKSRLFTVKTSIGRAEAIAVPSQYVATSLKQKWASGESSAVEVV